jgi:hypothetical protein
MNDLAARTLGLRVRAASTFGVARGTMRIATSAMIEEFAMISGEVSCEFLDLNRTSRFYSSSVPYDPEVRSRPERRTLANFGIGTLVAER